MHGENLRKFVLETANNMGLFKLNEAKCLECGRDCEDGLESCPGCGAQLGSLKKDDANSKSSEKENKRAKHEEITRKRAVQKEEAGYEDEPVKPSKKASSTNLT